MDINVCFVIVSILFAGVRTFILPSPGIISHQPAPECTSYSSLCHLSYGYFDDNGNPIEMLDSSSPICTCPGHNSCTSYPNNTISKSLPGSGNMTMEVNMSYCELPKIEKDCRFDEPVLVTRGRGPLSFEIVGDFKCNCDRRLFPHNSWSDGAYNYVEYSCGKPRCSKLGTKICSLLQYKGEDTYEQEYYCRCKTKRHEICTGARPDQNRTIAYHWCIDERQELNI